MSAPRRGFQPIHFLFGLLMGGADIVPGVSGGTMALIVGIYERLIDSVRAAATAVVNLVRGRVGEMRRCLGEVEWGLVLPLAAGILTAIVIAARLIEPALEEHPVPLRALFFGLIAGSLAIPWRRIPRRKRSHVGIAAGTAILAFVLTGLPPAAVANPGPLAIFLTAAVAICAMILPGVSGAFLLLVMGMYEPTLAAVNARDVVYIGIFGLGAAVGLGAFSKLLSYLLETHHDLTMVALVGLMAGSLRALWPYQTETRELLGPPSMGSALMALGIAAIGFVAVTILARVGASIEERDARVAEPSRVDTV